MDATHHPVFPLSPQLVFEWFINRDWSFFVKPPRMTAILSLHESNINRDFGLKKAIFLFRHTFSNQNFITSEFIQPFSFALIMTSLELQPFGTVFLLKITQVIFPVNHCY
jgi:hypothetical protein